MKIAICGCRTAKKRLKFAAGGVADLMHFNAGRLEQLLGATIETARQLLLVPTARRNDISRFVGFFHPVLPDARQDHGGDIVLPKRCKRFCYRNKP